jgi:hypothetical protein
MKMENSREHLEIIDELEVFFKMNNLETTVKEIF